MRIAAVTIVMIVGLGLGSIILQIYLSNMQSKWPGLILPIVTFLISLIFILNIGVTWDMGETVSRTMMESGGLAMQQADPDTTIINQPPNVRAAIAAIASTFLIANVPTAVFLVIYFAAREKHRIRAQLEQMNVQDL
jgi:hypothetical protein